MTNTPRIALPFDDNRLRVLAADPRRMPYFAYGSNMCLEQMLSRCARPKPLGRAVLPGHRVEFHGYSKVWDGGVETVVESPGHAVWGLLFELDAGDAAALDAWQDVREDGSGAYFHYPALVADARGDTQAALLYKKDVCGPRRPPSREYLDFILLGARAAGLPAAYVDSLARVEAVAAGYEVPLRRACRRGAGFGPGTGRGGCGSGAGDGCGHGTGDGTAPAPVAPELPRLTGRPGAFAPNRD